MIAFLIILLLIAGIVIYKLNEKVEDDKVIKSNYSWKEKIRSNEGIIKYLESEQKNLLKNGTPAEVAKNREDIESYREEIRKLYGYIRTNEEYLKERGRI